MILNSRNFGKRITVTVVTKDADHFEYSVTVYVKDETEAFIHMTTEQAQVLCGQLGDAIRFGEKSKTEILFVLQKEYEAAHKVWMNTSVMNWDSKYQAIKKKKNDAYNEYERVKKLFGY